MAKYRVDTDNGSYIVETEDAPGQPQPQQPNPSMNATISAQPAPQGIGEKVTRWAGDALGDLRYGGDRTVVGKALHAMGATPLYEGAPKEAAEFVESPAIGALRVVKGAGQVATPGKRMEGVKEVAAGAMQAAQIPASFVAPEGMPAGQGAAVTKAVQTTTRGVKAAAQAVLPSAERAGGRFAEVASAAGDLPINVNAPGEIALRAQKLAESGGSMPKVLRDFLKRVTDPDKAELTYNEARDFYSNATRLSADETRRLAPVMRRTVAEFTHYLDKSIKDAAEQVGNLETYQKAMREYHNAMRLRAAKEGLVKAATGTAAKAALGTAAGGYVAHEILK